MGPDDMRPVEIGAGTRNDRLRTAVAISSVMPAAMKACLAIPDSLSSGGTATVGRTAYWKQSERTADVILKPMKAIRAIERAYRYVAPGLGK
jgi:hypothetical protein